MKNDPAQKLVFIALRNAWEAYHSASIHLEKLMQEFLPNGTRVRVSGQWEGVVCSQIADSKEVCVVPDYPKEAEANGWTFTEGQAYLTVSINQLGPPNK